MRTQLPDLVESSRVVRGMMASSALEGPNGAFLIPYRDKTITLQVIASNGMGWEHVSVCILGLERTPTWPEMDYVKNLFWSPEEMVMQLHPARVQWVNNHRFVLHLWRPVGKEIPAPPQMLVGIPELGTLNEGKSRRRHKAK